MAEINSGDGGKKDGKKRSKKASTKVDMTPMVDLAFLLITFFMLTTTLSKRHAIAMTLPAKSTEKQKVKMSESITLILGEKDIIYWYDNPKEPVVNKTTYAPKDGVRDLLMKRNESVDTLVVVIKPMETSKYKNMIDIMDEIKITKIKASSISDITKEDIELVKGYEANFK